MTEEKRTELQYELEVKCSEVNGYYRMLREKREQGCYDDTDTKQFLKWISEAECQVSLIREKLALDND